MNTVTVIFLKLTEPIEQPKKPPICDQHQKVKKYSGELSTKPKATGIHTNQHTLQHHSLQSYEVTLQILPKKSKLLLTDHEKYTQQ
jgi:hypothetical protein